MLGKKILGAVTSVGVMAGLVAAGAVATAAPAAALDPGFFQVGSFDPSRDNPTLPAQCGLDFGLVLDSSGSIGNGDSGMVALRKATNAFVESLVDTQSKVSVTSFSTVSPGQDNLPPNPPNVLTPGTNLVPTKLTSANLTTPIKASYENLWSDGFTNWQDGLLKSQANFSQGSDPFSGGYPDLLVFITDGNPNTTNTSGGGSATLNQATNAAIAVANDMKLNGVKTFGIAVGDSNAINLNTIRAITNTTSYNGSNFPTAGYVQTDSYDQLAQQLKELAVDLCAPSLTITKEVKRPDTQNEFVPADGWTFNTTIKIPDGTGKWVTPDKDDPIAKDTASTKSVVTSGGGGATFQWEPNGDFTTKPVVISENLKDGYERDPQLTCIAKNVLAGTQRELNPIVDANGNWTLDEIKAREIVSCTAQNTLTRLNLTKVVQGGTAAAKDFTLTATPEGSQTPDYSKQGDSATFEPIKGDVVYTLGETGPAGYSQSGNWTCTGLTVQNGNQVTVPKGTQTTCTVTNTRDLAQLKLVKEVDGADPNKWTLSATAGAPDTGFNFSNEGAEGEFKPVYAGTQYTLAEDGPGGYSASDWACVNSPREESAPAQTQQEIDLKGDKLTLEPWQRVTCTITNTRDKGSLKIGKELKANGAPVDVNTEYAIGYKCGADPKQTVKVKAGQSKTIGGIPTGTECEVTEATPTNPPTGWSYSTPTFAPTNGKVTVEVKDQTVTVLVKNELTRDKGSVTITKEFNPQGSGYTGTFDINYTCVDGAAKVKEGTVKLAAGKSETITGLPTGTVCTVTEPTLPANPSGWTFNPPTFSPADGKATVTAKDQTASVTVTNSVAQVNPIVVKKICPIDVTLHKPTPKKVGKRTFTNKIKTKKSSCVLLKPVVLCRPLAATAAGETAFCDTKVTKKGRITVKTKGYDAVKVTAVVRTKPKPGFFDQWKPNTWRKSWKLK